MQISPIVQPRKSNPHIDPVLGVGNPILVGPQIDGHRNVVALIGPRAVGRQVLPHGFGTVVGPVTDSVWVAVRTSLLQHHIDVFLAHRQNESVAT